LRRPFFGFEAGLVLSGSSTEAARRTTMKKFAGLDVSLKEISICVVDAGGSVLLRGMVLTDPAAVVDFFVANKISLELVV
jgi:hypothetical protein